MADVLFQLRTENPSRVWTISTRAGFVIQVRFPDSTVLLKVAPEDGALNVAQEAHVLNRLGDAYASRVMAIAQAGQCSAVALRWIESESLASRWSKASTDPAQQRADLRATASELLHIHATSIVHGDLQPSHIRFGSAGVALIDFGVAGPPSTSYGGGLIHYLAPENAARLQNGDHPLRTFTADWYSLVASAFTARTRLPPAAYPQSASRQERLHAISHLISRANFTDPWDEELSQALLLAGDDRRDWVLSL